VAPARRKGHIAQRYTHECFLYPTYREEVGATIYRYCFIILAVALDSRKSTIGTALLIAVVLVVGAYILSGRHAGTAQTANAESSQAILQAYAAKDTDSDGLPDWEEALYGTSPDNAHSIRADTTDAQAVAQGLATPRYAAQAGDAPAQSGKSVAVPGPAPAAGSITEQFSRLFFDNYLATRGDTPPTAQEMQAFIQNAVSSLEQTRARPDAFSATDIKVSGSGDAALKAYAAAMDAASGSVSHPHLPYDELTYFSDAVQKNDAKAIANVDAIGKTYLETATALAKVAVPQEAAASHLALVNAMARVGGSIEDLAVVNSDPIRAMLGLQSYAGDVTAFQNALSQLDAVFVRESVALSASDPGSAFYALLTNAAANTSHTP
jgi:hypothetical protein